MLSEPIQLYHKERTFVAQMIREASASGVGIPWFSDNSADGRRLGLSEFLPVIMVNGYSLEENYRTLSKSPGEWIGSPEFAQQAAFILDLLSPEDLFDSDAFDPGLHCFSIARHIASVTGRMIFDEAVVLGALAAGFILGASPYNGDDLIICYISHLSLYRAVFKLMPEMTNA